MVVVEVRLSAVKVGAVQEDLALAHSLALADHERVLTVKRIPQHQDEESKCLTLAQNLNGFWKV